MEFTLGIITYKKNLKIQLLESPLIESIKSQVNKNFSIVIYINSYVTTSDRVELRGLMNSMNIPYELLGGTEAVQVPIARNRLLEYMAFAHQGSAVFMPDDDDRFFDEYATQAMISAVETYGLSTPIVTSFNGLRNKVVPFNRRIMGSPEDIYNECSGYFNWNMIFDIDWFISNQFSFPEFLEPPHRSHDTLISVKNNLFTKNKPLTFLTNCIMDYKYPAEGGTLSDRTKRPDSTIFDIMEYLYSESHMTQVTKKVFYDAVKDTISEIDEDTYRSLRFRRPEEKDEIINVLFSKNHHLVDFMGRVHDNLLIEEYKNLNGIDYVGLSHGDYAHEEILYVKLIKYMPFDSMKESYLYRRFVSKEITNSDKYSNHLYVIVK